MISGMVGTSKSRLLISACCKFVELFKEVRQPIGCDALASWVLDYCNVLRLAVEICNFFELFVSHVPYAVVAILHVQ